LRVARHVLETLIKVLGKPSYIVLQLSANELREIPLITDKTLEVSVRSIMKADEEELLKLYDEYSKDLGSPGERRIKGISVVWHSDSCVIMFNGTQLKVRSCRVSGKLLKILKAVEGASIRMDVVLQ